MTQLPENSTLNWSNKPWVLALLLVGLAFGIAATGYRTYEQYSMPSGEFDWTNRGHSDFHNGAYFPSLAFREGVNPYSTEASDRYLLPRSSPIYSPVVFFWHLPFTFLSLYAADVAYFVCNTAMLGCLAWMGIRMSNQRFGWGPWVLFCSLLVFSRPGHITLFTGYFTAELVIGTIIALHFASTRPFVSGCGMLLASGKPTYIVPLFILMLCRRNYRAVAIGSALCAVGVLIGLGWLMFGSDPMEVVAGINEGRVALHEDPTEDPVNTWTRLDVLGVVSKVIDLKPGDFVYLASMLLMLLIPGWIVFQASVKERDQGATGLTALIVCLAMLISIYHHSYDALLVAVPWFGLAFYRSIDTSEISDWARRCLVVLLAVPFVNYLSTRMFLQKTGLSPQGFIWEVITSVNGAALLIALCLSCYCAWKKIRTLAVHASNRRQADFDAG